VNINLLFLTPYNLLNYGGVQHQINLMNDYIGKTSNIESKIAGPNSKDYDLGRVLNIPFNNSVASITLFPDRKKLLEAIEWSDVVHIHEPFIPLIFWKLPKNKKYIFTHHANLNKLYTFFMSIIYKIIKIKGVSVYVSESALSNAKTLNNQPILIPNMIEVNKNIEFNNKKKFLFVGRNEKRKNFNYFKLLSKEKSFQDYEFEAITNENIENFNGVIYLKPNDDEKNIIFKNSSIYFALNTKNESFGITLIEAINSGNIVICSDLAAFKDVLEESGIYYERNSYKSLLNLLTNTLKSDLNFLWEKQYESIQKYDVEKNMENYVLLYLNN
jgi:glycosyltransferase involved in cell wall biosynthesis